MSMNPRTSLTLAAALAVLACTPAIAGAADPQIADGSLQRGLDAARGQWKAAHVRSYRYEIRVSCFCAPSTGHVVYVVRNGIPRVPSKGEKSVASVPRLFRKIQAAIDGGVAQLDVTYGRYGIPRSIYIDRAANIADEEVGYKLVHFTRLQ
jgi:hypothetical protein